MEKIPEPKRQPYVLLQASSPDKTERTKRRHLDAHAPPARLAGSE